MIAKFLCGMNAQFQGSEPRKNNPTRIIKYDNLLINKDTRHHATSNLHGFKKKCNF